MVATDNFLLDFAEELQKAASIGGAWESYTKTSSKLGVKSAMYGFFPVTTGQALSKEIITLSNHPEEYEQFYIKNGFIDHDPLAKYCFQEEIKPLLSGNPRADRYSTVHSARVKNTAIECGLEFGLTVPLKDASGQRLGGAGIAIDALNTEEADRLLMANARSIEQVAMLFHAHAQGLEQLKEFFPLTLRERECLTWAASGLSNKEIADRLNLSIKTVELHIQNACRRVNARNRTHAVARALIYGLILP